MQPFLNQKRGDCALSCYQEEEQDFANGIPRGRGSSDAAQPSHSVLTQIARGNRIVGDKFDRAVTALRTFKAGYVGYEKICGTAMTFCPLNVGEYGHSDLFIPLGHYSISESEATVLAGHSKAMHAVRDSAMQMACRRLADAETRLHDEDRLVDAVIGLEAWLLTDGNRSELSYRFALNYSTLGTTPAERYELYQRARTLYSLRSSIAHGGEPATSSQPLSDEAKSACEMLRAVILRFLSVASTKLPKDYWLNRVLGVSQ